MKTIKPNDPRLQLRALDRVLHWGYTHRKDDGPVIAWVTNPNLDGKPHLPIYCIYNDRPFIRLSHNIEDAESGRGNYEPIERIRIYTDADWAIIMAWRERTAQLSRDIAAIERGRVPENYIKQTLFGATV